MPVETERAGSDGDAFVVGGRFMTVDGLSLRTRVSERRTRLGLTVERDGSLTLRVPPRCDVTRAENFVRSSRSWIEDKLRLVDGRRQLHPVRHLRDGEIHRYLGRDYRLLLVDEEDTENAWDDGPRRSRHGGPAPVRLKAGRMRLSRSLAAEPRRAQKAIATWYCRTGRRWVRGRLQPWAARLDVPEPTVDVRDLGYRWGTYRRDQGGAGRVALHWAVFQLPPHLVDYVVAHELAHSRIAGHGADYWRLLARALPECGRLRSELDELGRRVWMGDVAE